LAGTLAPLLDFTKSDYDLAVKSDKLVVLYFYASWCPLCKEETANGLYPAFNALKDSRIVGFRVNYNDNDTDSDEKALAREFGVGYQHTKVFVKNGSRILKSPESWDKERYLNEINKVI
jgi:thiol-disulfide isomerase/thioredoxin